MLIGLPVKAPVDLVYDETLEGYYKDGKRVDRVSDFLDRWPKPWMKNWVLKEARNNLIPRWREAKNLFELSEAHKAPAEEIEPKWEQFLRDGMKSAERKSEAALDTGDMAHKWIAHHIKGEQEAMPDNPESICAIQAFLKWETDYNPEYLAAEWRVYHAGQNYAGTFDVCAAVRDSIRGERRLGIGDFKTSSALRDTYNLQLAAYQDALFDMYQRAGEPIPEFGRFLVHLPKDGKSYRMKWVSTSLDADVACLRALKLMGDWEEYYKAQEKVAKAAEKGKS